MNNDSISYTEAVSLINEQILDINITSKHINKNILLVDKGNRNYKYKKKNIFYRIFSSIFYFFIFIVLYPILLIYFVPKVKGKKNLRKIKNAVFIANHTFNFDCAIIDIFALPFKKPLILSQKENFQIPGVKSIIKLLSAIPIPKDIPTYKKFYNYINKELKNNKSLLIYPEGSLWPYFPKVRPFKNGAFKFAIKNNVPIVPIVLSFRKPNKFYKLFGRKKPFINVNILDPIFVEDYKNKEEEIKLNNLVYNKMTEVFNSTNTYIYVNEKRLKREKQKNSQNSTKLK